MPLKNPPHPGRILRDDCLEPLGLSVTAAAKALGVSRQALNNVVNERAGISPEMAIRIAKHSRHCSSLIPSRPSSPQR